MSGVARRFGLRRVEPVSEEGVGGGGAGGVVDCAVYVGGERVAGECGYAQALGEVREKGEGFVWLGVHDPEAALLGDIARVFGLHPLAVSDAARRHQRPKVMRFDEVVVLVLRTVNYVAHDPRSISEIVQTGEILVFTGPDFVIAVRYGEHCGLRGVRQRLEGEPKRLSLGPGAVLQAIADHVVESFREVTTSVEQDVDAMEEEVFTPRSKLRIEAVYQLKREIVELRRAVGPLGGALQQLAQPEAPFGPDIRRYIRVVGEHHAGVAERIADIDDALSSLINAALAIVSVQQNTDMRKISAWAAIAAVPTMLAGIYGMNFEHMPELKQVWGYPAVLGVMVLSCVILAVIFRRNRWL